MQGEDMIGGLTVISSPLSVASNNVKVVGGVPAPSSGTRNLSSDSMACSAAEPCPKNVRRDRGYEHERLTNRRQRPFHIGYYVW